MKKDLSSINNEKKEETNIFVQKCDEIEVKTHDHFRREPFGADKILIS